MKLVTLGCLAAALVLSFSTPSFARSVDRTAVVAALSGDLEKMDTVYLLADGRLQIKMADGTVQTALVSKLATDELVKTAIKLSDVKLDETHSRVVCSMRPMPAMREIQVSGYDSKSAKFDSKLRVILTAEGCNVAYHAKPSDDEALASVLQFRAQLLVLALNALK